MSGIRIPWSVIVGRADPDRARDLAREPQYEFSRNKTFRGDTRRTGVYSRLAPYLARAPRITGFPVVGNVIEVDLGEHIGSPPPTVTCQWHANGVPLPGSDEPKLLLIEADAGDAFSCVVTASNGVGSPVVTTTAPVIVTARPT